MQREAPAFDATLEGVAALAGVSRSTASRVINGSPHVTEQVVTRVNAAIAQLGYVPNRTARSLVRGRTQTIAMVIPERTAAFFSDPYFAEVIQGAAMYASTTDYSLTLLIESESDPDKTFRFLRKGNVDGALILSHYSSSASYLELSRSLPVVFGVQPPVGADPYDDIVIVDVDNLHAGELAVRHLIDRGRTRIATIAGPLTTVAGHERLEAWRTTLAAAGLEPGGCEEGDYTPASGAAAVQRLLEGAAPFDALFVASAQMAAGALDVLTRAGRRVPEDVAIATVDNNSFSTSPTPALTTVDLHTSEKGAAMVAAIVQLIAEGSVSMETSIPVDLVVRASS
jgi:LacI family transcriptional regulator